MASNEKHVCEICGCDEQPIVFHSGIYQHANLVECIIALKRQRKELRALLETATDAWLDGGQLWHDSKLYADYKQAALPKDWYEKARK